MKGAERYLTQKAKVGKPAVLLENAAAIALFLLMAAGIYVAFYGYQVEGVNAAHAILCVIEVLLVIPLNLITERKRHRKHAELIVRALLRQDSGRIPCDELEKASGVRKAADAALQLVEKGYLTGVALRKGDVCLMDLQPEEQEEKEIVPIFRN